MTSDNAKARNFLRKITPPVKRESTKRRVIIFTHGDRIVHIPGMNTGFLVMKPAIAAFTPQTASSAQPYYQQPSAEIDLKGALRYYE